MPRTRARRSPPNGIGLGCDWVLYVGDDETDEDAFALGGNMVPVRVGRKQRSHARYLSAHATVRSTGCWKSCCGRSLPRRPGAQDTSAWVTRDAS